MVKKPCGILRRRRLFWPGAGDGAGGGGGGGGGTLGKSFGHPTHKPPPLLEGCQAMVLYHMSVTRKCSPCGNQVIRVGLLHLLSDLRMPLGDDLGVADRGFLRRVAAADG